VGGGRSAVTVAETDFCDLQGFATAVNEKHESSRSEFAVSLDSRVF
jgi:hypothetical protein